MNVFGPALGLLLYTLAPSFFDTPVPKKTTSAVLVRFRNIEGQGKELRKNDGVKDMARKTGVRTPGGRGVCKLYR